jgi:hypothetical protein
MGGGGFTISPFGEPILVGADGRFKIDCLGEAVSYGLTCQAEKRGSMNDYNIEGKAGKTIDKGDIVLAVADRFIEGKIIDTTGAPIAGVDVGGNGESQPENLRATTDKDGKYRLGPLSVGRLFIYCNKQGYSHGQNDVQVIKGQNEQVDFELAVQDKAMGRLRPGVSAPPFLGVTWLAGKGDLAALQGRPVAVVFFNIVNRPSLVAMNKIMALQKKIGSDRLAVVAIHDSSAPAGQIKQLCAAKQYICALGRVNEESNQGWKSPAFRAWEVRGLPCVTLIDPAGRIRQADVPLAKLDSALHALVAAGK